MGDSLDLMNRMGLVNEDSINAKQRNIKRVENAFNNGVSNYIRCFAVLDAFNCLNKLLILFKESI